MQTKSWKYVKCVSMICVGATGANQDNMRKEEINCQDSRLMCTHLLTAMTSYTVIDRKFCNHLGLLQLNEIYSQHRQKIVIRVT